MEIGFEEGSICNRDGCKGVITLPKVQGCSCHISPPCNACTDNMLTCSECGWEDKRETFNDHTVSIDAKTGRWHDHGLRQLDPSKLDWHNFSHSNCSMIKRGVYPIGMTSSQVREKVDGTFGGRFTYFENGKFEFIAYTD